MLAVLGVLATLGTTARAHHDAQRSTTVHLSFRSQAVRRQLHFFAYLPAGYPTGRLRYPVVYFLHGLPAGERAYEHIEWLRSALDSLPHPVILVAPQGSTHEDADPEYLDWGPGRNWETAIAQELPRFVDTRLRTIPNRKGRALVGLSAGGYGAVLLALHHLDDFAVIESWSGYFHPTNPAGTQVLDLGSPARNSPASAHAFVKALRSDQKRRPTFFAFYVGEGDVRFHAENVQLDHELDAAGVRHFFAVYPGAHESTVWSAHAKTWLRLAAQHLAAARR